MPMDEREQAELFEHEARVQAEHDALANRVRELEHEIEALTAETDEQIRALTAGWDRLADRVKRVRVLTEEWRHEVVLDPDRAVDDVLNALGSGVTT